MEGQAGTVGFVKSIVKVQLKDDPAGSLLSWDADAQVGGRLAQLGGPIMDATSKRGCVIERMYVRLKRGETTQNFNIWVYGEKQLSRGSGLFVPESGTAYNNHFLLPADGTNFQFLPGTYSVEVLAN